MAGNTLNARTGPAFSSDGVSSYDLRQGQHGEAICGQFSGKYTEASRRGLLYSAVSAAAGVVPGFGAPFDLGATAAFSLYNPVGTGKRLVVLQLGMGLISGTLGAGTIWITSDGTSTAVPSGGTAVTPRPLKFSSATSSVASVATGATVTTQAGKMCGVLCSVNQIVIATTAVNSEMIVHDVDGLYIIEAGCLLTLQATSAAGTNPRVAFVAVWEEQATS